MEWDKYDVCVGMHAALRKCCDSRLTSALYSLIFIMDPEKRLPEEISPWFVFGELIVSEMATLSPEDAFLEARKNLRDVVEERLRKRDIDEEKRPPPLCRQYLYALSCTLDCMDDGDIAGMTAYLQDE